MANRARKVATAVAFVGAVLAPRAGAAAETPAVDVDPARHVRPTTPAIASLIADGMEGSATFREIVRTIEESDTYVYVLQGECGHGVRACFDGVTTAGPRRIMRVTVSLDSRAPRWSVIGSIGHELRHTIEAIQEPSVRSNEARFFLYERIGFQGTSKSRETTAAVETGNTVRAEIRRFARSARPE